MIVKRKNLKSFFLFSIVGAIILYLTYTEADDVLSCGCRVMVSLVLVYCLTKGAKEADITNPYWLFSLVPFSLLLYTEKVSSVYLKHLESKTWIFALINMIAFLVGLSIYRKSEAHGLSYYDDMAEEHSEKFYIYNAVILFALGKLPFIYKLITGSLMPFNSIIVLFQFAAIVCAVSYTHLTLPTTPYV